MLGNARIMLGNVRSSDNKKTAPDDARHAGTGSLRRRVPRIPCVLPDLNPCFHTCVLAACVHVCFL